MRTSLSTSWEIGTRSRTMARPLEVLQISVCDRWTRNLQQPSAAQEIGVLTVARIAKMILLKKALPIIISLATT